MSKCVSKTLSIIEAAGTVHERPELRAKNEDVPALAFVRPGDVNDYLEVLEEIFPANAEVVTSYFEQYYIGTLRPNGQRRTPLFQQRLWNVFNKVLEGHPRTNNSQEGWHRHFSSQVT